ncbi:MAG: hypothetical protein JW751_14545 [Polyangiaceae bacterium]|nr:hypothetical protein [Polyangiaceae bacterium]
MVLANYRSSPRRSAGVVAVMAGMGGGVMGCARVGLDPNTAQEHHRVLYQGQTEETAHPALSAFILSDRTRLGIALERLCVRGSIAKVEGFRTEERVNLTPARDWLWGATGVAFAVTGTAVIAAHERPEGRAADAEGDGTAVALGTGMIVLGVAALAVPVVDAIRSGGAEETIRFDEVAREPAPLGARASRCVADGRVPRATLELAGPSGTILPLGKTNDQGLFRVDLARFDEEQMRLLFPADHGSGYEVTLRANGVSVGEVDLGPVLRLLDDRAWQQARLADCRSPLSIDACSGVETYLASHPSGAHAEEARRALANAADTLRRWRDDAAWDRSNSTVCFVPGQGSVTDGGCR